jgi:Icc-related predicted phosphoesterase
VLERHPNVAPAQRALAATLSPDALLLILNGQASLEALYAQAWYDAAGRSAAEEAQVASDAAAAAALEAELDAEDARVAAEHAALEKEEMKLLKARMAALAFREEGHAAARLCEAAGAEPFTTLVRSPTSDTNIPSATWRWREGAWHADERPATERPYLQLAFIADTHGAHSMLDRYMCHEAVASADVLCLCGDVIEHEEGHSVLEDEPGVERYLARWLHAQPQRFKLMVSGNHDKPMADGEASALRGEAAPHAGAQPRAYLHAVGAPCMYLQDEAAVITLHSGERITIYGTPWHPVVGGLFEYDPKDPDMCGKSPLVKEPVKHAVKDRLCESWGAAGDAADVVLCHGPPKYILDSVGSTKKCIEGEAVGCEHMLKRLRAVRPAVVAFGHVHANQGLRHLRWTMTKEATAYRKSGKDALAAGEAWPARPGDVPRSRRTVRGDDLSDVAAGAATFTGEQNAERLTPAQQVAMEADLARTLFVNAACMNATTPLVQHGIRVIELPGDVFRVELTAESLKRAAQPPEERKSLRSLRPPIVVRVYPGAGARAEVVPLGVERFPE